VKTREMLATLLTLAAIVLGSIVAGVGFTLAFVKVFGIGS
jgi:hypothetical protein